jgi:hypothetical protein
MDFASAEAVKIEPCASIGKKNSEGQKRGKLNEFRVSERYTGRGKYCLLPGRCDRNIESLRVLKAFSLGLRQ